MTVFLKSYRQPNVYFCTPCGAMAGLERIRFTGTVAEVKSFFKSGVEFLLCSGCKSAAYCSIDCQKADWRKHKDFCRMISAEVANEERTEIIAENLRPLCEGACSQFSALAVERSICCNKNLVYVMFSGRNNRYFEQIELALRLRRQNQARLEGIPLITGFSHKYLHRRYRDMYAYLHFDEEIYAMIIVHPEVKAAIAQIFALGVPNTRVLLFFHRDGKAVSVSAGTKVLFCHCAINQND